MYDLSYTQIRCKRLLFNRIMYIFSSYVGMYDKMHKMIRALACAYDA